VVGSSGNGNGCSGYTKDRVLLDQLSDYQPLKKGSAPCSPRQVEEYMDIYPHSLSIRTSDPQKHLILSICKTFRVSKGNVSRVIELGYSRVHSNCHVAMDDNVSL
jgi:hypothetical protein